MVGLLLPEVGIDDYEWDGGRAETRGEPLILAGRDRTKEPALGHGVRSKSCQQKSHHKSGESGCSHHPLHTVVFVWYALARALIFRVWAPD